MDTSSSSETQPTDLTLTGSKNRKLGRIAANFSWLMAGEIAAKGLAFVTTVYLARVLGKDDFGLFSFATALMTYGMLLTDFGLSTYGTREVAGRYSDLRRCIANVQSTRLVLSFVLLALGTVLSLVFFHDRRLQLLVILSLVGLIPYAVYPDWAFKGLEKMGYSALGNTVQQAVSLAPILLFVSGPAQLLLVPICKTLGWLAAAAVLMVNLRKLAGHSGLTSVSDIPQASTIRGMLKAGVPLAATYLMVQVFCNMDTVLLGIMDTPAAVGIYAAGYKVVNLASAFCYTLTAAFYPSLSHDFRHDRAAYRSKLVKMLFLVFSLGTIGMTGAFFLRHFIVLKLYGPGYSGATAAISILCMAILGDCMVAALSSGFLAAGLDKLVLMAMAAGAIPNIILNIVLIPRYSLMGAAAATVISYALMVIFYLANFHRIFHRRDNGEPEEQGL